MARSTRVRLIGIAEHPPDLRTRRRDIVECDWHDADDGHRIVVDRDGASDDRAVRAVAPFPKPVTEDDDLIVLWDVFLGGADPGDLDDEGRRIWEQWKAIEAAPPPPDPAEEVLRAVRALPAPDPPDQTV